MAAPRAWHGQRFLPALMLLVVPPLSAQPSLTPEHLLSLSLEELIQLPVTTATKTAAPGSRVPASITVITAADIDTYGYTSVADALQHVVGFVDSHDLAVHNFGVRGIHAGARAGSRALKFMIDGQAIAFRATGQHFIDRELIPIELIERIEVVRGPVSALYGANALLGVVNIITRRADQFAAYHQRLRLEGERRDAAGDGWHLSYAGGHQVADWSAVLGLSLGRSDRAGIPLPKISPDYASHASYPAARSDVARPGSFYGTARWHEGEHQQLQLAAHYQRLDSDHVFTDLNPLRPTGTTRLALDNRFLRLDYQFQPAPALDYRFHVAWASGAPTAADRIDTGASSFFLRRELGYDSIDTGAELLWHDDRERSVLLGIDTSSDRFDIESFRRVNRQTGSTTLINPPRDEVISNAGLFLQVQQPLLASWQGIAGVRLDHNSQYGQETSARLGLVGSLDHDRVIKLMAGRAFQAPSPELLFRNAIQLGDIVGNPELAPQHARTLELSFATPLSQHSRGTVTLFQTDVEDLVTLQSNLFNLLARNSSDSRSRGIEFEAQYRRLPWSAYANYSWQKTRRERNPRTLLVLEQRDDGELFPNHSGNLGISVQLAGGRTVLSCDNRYVGKRLASTQNVLVAQREYALSAYLDTTLTLSHTVFQSARWGEGQVRLQVRDLFDTRYVNTGFGGIELPSEGRRYLLSYQQRF